MPLIDELASIKTWLGPYKHSPNQLNSFGESDCELIQISEETYLASTIDSVSEEIALKLYTEPFTMGWVTAMAALSDLAAVGAKPIGLLFSSQWQPDKDNAFKTAVSSGLKSALETCGTYLLGGDTGSAMHTVLTGVGLGLCSRTPVTRKGMKPGDYLCITGKTGTGPALALRFLRNEPKMAFEEALYRPQARLTEGLALNQFASAIMDTSDGILTTLDTLKSINENGLDLYWNENILDPKAVEYCQGHKLPLWCLWLAEHGDFELIASIPPQNLALAQKSIPTLNVIGRVTERPECNLHLTDKKTIHLDLASHRALQAGKHPNHKDISQLLESAVHQIKREGLP